MTWTNVYLDKKSLKTIGAFLKARRRAQDFTMTDVSKITGIDQATLSRIENGLMLGNVKTHLMLAFLYGYTPNEIYDEVKVCWGKRAS